MSHKAKLYLAESYGARWATFTGANPMAETWYAIYTRFQHEKSAATLLEKKDFEVFLPVYQALHHWCDRKQVVTLPLFPCYLFLRTSVDRKLEVLRTGGVRWFVENAKQACEVSDEEISTLRRVCSLGVGVLPHPFLKQGDQVRVRTGPLAGTDGIFVRTKNQFRVVISVELLRKGVSVEVSRGDIESIADHTKPCHYPSTR